MAKEISEIQKKRGRGRPPTGSDPLITIRLARGTIDALDTVAERKGASRSEIIRQLIEVGLKRRSKP